MEGLAGRAVIVTGGASGIGRAICHRLGREGCRVAIFDRNGEGAEAVASEIGNGATSHTVDISDYEAVARAVAAFEQAAGRIDGLVNNAGWDQPTPFADTDRALWDKIIAINLYGPLNVTHCVLKGMIARGAGRIVHIASDAGRVGAGNEAVYSATKGGTIAFGKALAQEVARHNITVNTVCPGATDTPLLRSVDAAAGGLAERLRRATPLRRLAVPEDYAGIVALLLSDEAAFITGQAISVSGGLTMC